MADNYRETGRTHQDQYPVGVRLVNDFVGSLVEQKLLPQRFQEAHASLQPQVTDLKPARPLQPVALEIPTVSEELYNRTREALAEQGFTHVVTIQPLSMGLLATDEATSNRFDYVNPSENMCSITPPQMEVVFDPKNLKIKNSNSKSTDTQIKMTGEDEAKLKGELPEDVRGLISMPMPNASTLAQADFDYQDKTGKPLYPDFWVRTDDETAPGRVADVGRRAPSDRLPVNGWCRDYSNVYVFAARVVVLPRKLAVEQPAE